MSNNLLFLPGLLEDADCFAAQIEALGAGATSVVADLTSADTMEALAREALKQAPAGPLAIVGHSMGGYVALEIMRRAPERVARLALLNSHARADTAEASENRRRLMALADKDFPGVIATLLPKLMTEEHLRDSLLAGTVSEMALAVGKEAFIRQERAIIGRADSRPHLGKIACKTLVVAAREDALMPLSLLEELASGIRGAELTIIEASGHLASLEQPEAVTAALKHWLEDS